jgi:ribosome-associated heat shock protein Hsp15
MTEDKNENEIRLDKWLKIARFYKQREKAADEVDSGKVRVNGQRVKPSRILKIGDELTVKIDNKYRKFTVKLLLHRSVSAEIARTMYEAEILPADKEENREIMELIEMQFTNDSNWEKGKPNKKERRILQKFKHGQL